jgi:transposase
MAQWSLLGREPLLDFLVSPQFVTPVSAIGCALLIHFVDPFLPLSFLNETSTPVSLALAQSWSYPIFLEKIKQGERIFADETTLPTLAPGSGKTQKAWLWAYARDDRPFGGADPPMVAYRSEDSRSGDCVARHLAGFGGLLQVDGYAACNRLAKGAGANDGVTLAACFAHVRRRFYELHVNESSHLATQMITTMAALWKVEEDIRSKDPATRVKARQEKSAAIVARLFELWEAELPRLSGKSKLA